MCFRSFTHTHTCVSLFNMYHLHIWASNSCNYQACATCAHSHLFCLSMPLIACIEERLDSPSPSIKVSCFVEDTLSA